MSTQRMRTPERLAIAELRAAACLLALLVGTAAAQPNDPAPPVGVPAHGMLEDPFNRSLLLDELEIDDRDARDALAWDATVWAGYAFNKLAVRTQGEKSAGTTEHAELELLWSHSVTRWWDVVAGGRADFAPGSTQSWAAIGVQGLAPYRFHVEVTAYLGDGGDAAARFEGEYELLISPRLILQPQIELEWYGQSDPARGIGSGLATAEAGLRLRYEFRREIAPYVGVVRERRFGASADFARAEGKDPDDTRWVAGIRLRF